MDNGDQTQKGAAGIKAQQDGEGASLDGERQADVSPLGVDLEAEMLKDFDAYFRSADASDANEAVGAINVDQSDEDDVLAEMSRYDVASLNLSQSSSFPSSPAADLQKSDEMQSQFMPADILNAEPVSTDPLVADPLETERAQTIPGPPPFLPDEIGSEASSVSSETSLTNDLERELAHLQRGLTLPISDVIAADGTTPTEPMSTFVADNMGGEAHSDKEVGISGALGQQEQNMSEPSATTGYYQSEVLDPVVQPDISTLSTEPFSQPTTSPFSSPLLPDDQVPVQADLSDLERPSSALNLRLPSESSDASDPPLTTGMPEPKLPLRPGYTPTQTSPASPAPPMPAAPQFNVDMGSSYSIGDDVNTNPAAQSTKDVEGFDSSQLTRSAPSLDQDNPSSVQDGVDLSKLVAPSDEVEEVTPFDIPAIELTEDAHSAERKTDLGLDLELEREFSELLSEKSVSQPDIATPDAPAVPLGSIATAAHIDVATELKNYFASEQDNANLLPELAAASVAQSRPEKTKLTYTPMGKVTQASSEQTDYSERRSRFPIIAVLALALLGGGGFLFWQNYSGEFANVAEPIIIRADESAIKQVPTNPGGTLVPNQDQAVYDQVEGNDVTVANQSSLVENREEPIDIVQQTLSPDILPRNISPAQEDRLPPLNDTAVAADEVTEPSQPLVTPKKVRTVIVQSDGTIITREVEADTDNLVATAQNSAQNALEQPNEDIAAATVPQTPAVNVDDLRTTIVNNNAVEQTIVPRSDGSEAGGASDNTALAAEPSDNSEQVAAAINQAAQQVAENTALPLIIPTPSESPTSTESAGIASAQNNRPTELVVNANDTVTVAPIISDSQSTSAQPSAPAFDGYYMQIASQPSRAAAEATYADLSGQYSALLGGFNVVYQEAEIEGRGTFHRVRLEIGARSEAVNLCERFKGAGGSCFVTR